MVLKCNIKAVSTTRPCEEMPATSVAIRTPVVTVSRQDVILGSPYSSFTSTGSNPASVAIKPSGSREDVVLGSPYSGLSLARSGEEKGSRIPRPDPHLFLPLPSISTHQMLPTPPCYSRHNLLPTEFPIAPAFAQIFQRRRRRENRPRRQRTTFTSDQTLKLELEYTRADYITRPRRFELAEILHLSESQIKIWFQNRRAKDKRIEKAHMDHTLRAIGYENLPVTSFPPPTSQAGVCGTCAVPLHLPFPVPPLQWPTTTA